MRGEIEKLINELNYYTRLYDEGNPIISDKQWDEMYFKLVSLERLTGIYLENSPTQKVNYQVVNNLNKVEHSHKMLSLPKSKEPQEIIDFIGDKEFIAMPKYDGLTCSLTYENGHLVSAETRGDGFIGEDITHNAMVIPTIPKRINYMERLVVDGEIVCSYKDFKEFEKDYKNPRNFAAGSIRLLDSKECSTRKLDFIAWEVIEGLDNFKLLSEKITYLFDLGFKNTAFTTNEYTTVKDFIEEAIANRETFTIYPTDGIVFKFNNVEYGRSLGETSHHFNNAIAFKFYDETYPTNLLSIEWTMGRTGVLTPVAVFEPIDIDGSTVERASLHNISIMNAVLGTPYIGQQVNIFKANQIIPQIHSAEILRCEIENIKLPIIPTPSVCPVCGKATKIKQDYDTEVLVCSNPDCEGKLINKLDHFCSKKGLDIKGLSKATLEKLIDWGWVENITDIFKLENYKKEWYNKNGFGKKSVDNIIEKIAQAANECELEKFIASIGIPLIGTSTAKELVKHFKTYDEFKNNILNSYDFSTIDGFGPELHKAITSFNYTLADEIAEKHITFKAPKAEIVNNKILENLVFVITGDLNIYKNRAELTKLIEANGGKVFGTVSKNTSFLINNDINSTSSKNKRAKDLEVPIISESEFNIKFFDFE